jgi:hypothetical protein
MSSGTVSQVVARWRAACDEVAAVSVDALSVTERLALLDVLEYERRRQPALEHRLIAGVMLESTPAQLGAANWKEVLTQRLRIGAADAGLRLEDAELLGPRTTLAGERLEPAMAHVAKRQAAGEEPVKLFV